MSDGDSSYRLQADLEFRENMYESVREKASWWNAWWYRFMAWTYYKLVLAEGQDAFVYRSEDTLVTKDLIVGEALVEKREFGPLAMCRDSGDRTHGYDEEIV